MPQHINWYTGYLECKCHGGLAIREKMSKKAGGVVIMKKTVKKHCSG